MTYPEHLLPQSNYKIISSTDELCLCTLVRHTSSKDLYLLGTEMIDPDKLQIQSNHLKDLSTNILGIFELNDIYISVTNSSFFELWSLGDITEAPLINKDFILNNERGYFLFSINDIKNLKLPLIQNYTIVFDVIHTPTKCNFWHFSIRAFSDNIEISELPVSNKQKRMIWKSLKDFLVAIAFTNSTGFHILKRDSYTQN